MNLFETYRHHVLDALARVAPGFNTSAVTLEPPRDASHGDLSTNAAMVVGGQLKKLPPLAGGSGGNAATGKGSPPAPPQAGGNSNDEPQAGGVSTASPGAPAFRSPRELADALAEHLRALPDVTEVSVAGPGFINMRLAPSVWQGMVATILEHGVGFGNSTIGANKRVNVEYVSANPTGPLHIGHARGAVYGDALATLLMKAGYNVTREYYINDAGAQVEVLARSALLRYREALGETIEIPEGLYPGEYLRGVGEALKAKFGEALLKKPESAQIADAKAIAIDCMMALIKQDLFDLGIVHDVFTSEAALRDSGAIERAIEQLQAAGHLYHGTLEPPKGETPDDWEAKEQLLFRATAFGDDMDRTVQKSDGNYAYFAGDLALTMDKLRRHFEVLIYMLGADHGGYVKRLKAIAGAFSDNTVEADVLLCQLVRLTKNGEPVKMSKRAGTFVTVRDVLDEVGRDILRFVMLMRKSSQDMDFDLAKVKEQSKDNPVFYVHYAHARAKSLLRLAREQIAQAYEDSKAPAAELLALLTHPAELALIRLLASWPRQVEQAALAHEPHRVIYYLQEVAAAFHGLWNEADLRFIQPDKPALTAARLALARAMAVVLASGLAVCGVEPVEELRG